MQRNNKKKICIVVSSLGKGGAERSSALLSKMLTNLGYNIHIVSVLSGVDYEYSGTLFNLGNIKDKNDTFFGRLNRLFLFKNYLTKHKFDCIIDNRSRVQSYREFLICKFIYTIPTVYVIHSFKSSTTFTKHNRLNKFLYKNETMTTVSKAIKHKFESQFKLKKIFTIYNGFDFEDLEKKALQKTDILFKDYIIFYGRINDKVKNLKLLINAYKTSQLSQENIKLLILGDGEDYKMIVNYVESLKLEKDIIFKKFTSNPYPYVKNAKFSMLTSHFEGLPMVIPESLSLETPVISVDCQSGPNEIIKHKFNGLLVENHNKKALAKAMNSFIFEKELYETCKLNAKKSVEKFSMHQIEKDWSKLLKQIIK